MIAALAAVVTLLLVLVYLLLTGSLFSQEPRSDIERDYRLLLESSRKNPGDAATLMSLAEVEYELGKRKDAFEHAKKAVAAADERAYFHLRYATLLVREERQAEAVQELDAEIAISGGESGEPFFLLAQVQSAQGKHADAIKTMKRGLKLEPMAADMVVVYADILEKAGKKKEAIDQYKVALRYLPDEQDAIAGLKRLGVSYEPTSAVPPHASEGGQ